MARAKFLTRLVRKTFGKIGKQWNVPERTKRLMDKSWAQSETPSRRARLGNYYRSNPGFEQFIDQGFNRRGKFKRIGVSAFKRRRKLQMVNRAIAVAGVGTGAYFGGHKLYRKYKRQ